MRPLLYIPLAILLVAAGAWGLCVTAGWGLHGRELLIAAGAALAAGELGLLPTLLTRKASQGVVAQAALVGTVIHLFTLAIAAGVMYLTARPDGSFLYWLMAFYWATLAVLVAALSRAVRSAPPVATPEPRPAAN